MALVLIRHKCDGGGTYQSQRALLETLLRSTADVISFFSYWDLPYNNFNYSYIDVAVDKYGFCTLSIDRLGIGNSSIADPLQVIQAPAETSALYEVTVMLRNGTVPNIPQAFEKVVHVGHSFGSVLTYDLVAQYPRASDGIILTGYSQDGAFFFQTIADFNSKLARLNQPLRFGNISSTVVQQGLSMFIYSELDSIKNYLSKHQITITEVESVVQSTELGDLITGIYPTSLPQMQNLPTGYLTWSDAASNQYAFLYPGFFDPRILNFAESVKMPYTIGELLTIGSSPKNTDFKGPVQILTGSKCSRSH